MNKKRKIILWILIIIGFILAFDLTYIFIKTNFNLSGAPSFCSINNLIDCDGVARTQYSVFLGIPLAIWGVILYSLFTFLMIVEKLNEKFPNKIFALFKNPYSYIATFGLISFCISMLLATISIFEINKICVLCFGTYFVDLFIALTAKSKGFFLNDIKNTIKDFIQGVKQYTLLFLLVVILCCSILTYLTLSNVLAPNLQGSPYSKYEKLEKNPWAISGNTLGNNKGVIQVYVYGDFMCPFCRISNMFAHKLAKDNKNILIHHMNFPLDSACNPFVQQNIHEGACFLARYALAAKQQNNYWGMVNMIYNERPKDLEQLLSYAKEAGFDTDKLVEDANSKDTALELAMQMQFAHEQEINATPSFVISDILYTGIMPYEELLEKTKQAYKRYLRDNNGEQ